MLEDIRKNINRLIALYEAEKAENENLRSQLSESRAAVNSYREQISGLEEQIETLRLTQAFTAGGNTPPASKEKIDRMIKEIDRCISLLEKS